jgi:hypothetical protein
MRENATMPLSACPIAVAPSVNGESARGSDLARGGGFATKRNQGGRPASPKGGSLIMAPWLHRLAYAPFGGSSEFDRGYAEMDRQGVGDGRGQTPKANVPRWPRVML